MKQALLFVREKAKDEFIESANEALKFANNLFKEAKKAGFDEVTAWETARFAYNKPTTPQLEQHVKELLIGNSDNFEIAGLKLSVKKVADLMELPDLSGINALIDQANQTKLDLWQIPFSKIRNEKNIEFDSVWLSEKLDSFTVYAKDEMQENTFKVFSELVRNINKMVENKSQKQYFEFLEMEGLVKWHDTQFVIETKESSLRRLFQLFGANEAAIKRREAKGLKFSGSL